MNKKIFTLLAGALLGFTMVSSLNAQTLEKQELRVKPYDAKNPLKFSEGNNEGYYYLQLDSMFTYNKATGVLDTLHFASKKSEWMSGAFSLVPQDTLGSLRKGLTLYMGPDSAGQHALWIDVMGRMSGIGSAPVSNGYGAPNTVSKALESAAGLWCVNVNKYVQGQNPTFDFSNKLQEALLEVNVYGHEAWPVDVDGWRTSTYRTGANTAAQTPGSIASWEFSETYKTGVKGGRPLVSYLDETMDTVAVLVGNVTQKGIGYVQVKIAPATEVNAGRINGMLLFTLKEAMPFALDKKSFETILGTESSMVARSLKFAPNGTPNPFTDKKWEVEYFASSNNNSMLVDTSAWRNRWNENYYAWDVKPKVGANTPWIDVAFSSLEKFGYVALKNGEKYLYADTAYYNSGNTMFLKFAEGDALPTGNDNIMVGQYAWRMVYYPSGDSIYINPFSATYVPKYDPKAITDSTRYATDSVVRSWYTFTAYPTPALMQDTLPGYTKGTTPANPAVDVALEERITARLKWGVNPNREIVGGKGAPVDYITYHRLYVALQNLTIAGKQGTRVTLNKSNMKNGKINTHINFGCYAPCKLVASDRASIPADLYLIRNEKGQYLHVPLYSAHDSAVWVTLEDHVHPEVLPSFQWIVEPRYKNSKTSPVNIINREFGYVLDKDNYAGNAKKGQYGLAFMNIQLMKDTHAPFKVHVKNWSWNKENVNSNVIAFKDAKKDMGAKNAATFIRLPKEYKNDPKMGYQWIDPDTAKTNLYAFNYKGFTDNRYISVSKGFKMKDYPKTDTSLFVKGDDCFNIAYFRIDTVKNDAGAYKPYGYGVKGGKSDDGIWKKNQVEDLVQLMRQPYRISYESPFKYCLNTLCLGNGEQSRYSLSNNISNLRYDKYFGTPLFFMRDVYVSEKGQKNFALVQIVDTFSIKKKSESPLTPNSLFDSYLKAKLGPELADKMMLNLRRAGEFNPGLFVAAVADPSSRLLYTYRGDVQSRISTFGLVKDSDPLYRRFNTEHEGKNPGDAPETVNFYVTRGAELGKNYLYENTGTFQKVYRPADKNYLGVINSNSFPNVKPAIFVDTAYVNRGTGYIKPQYMLMIRPQIVEESLACDENGELKIKIPGYRRGMYLINATDSAKADMGTDHEKDYLWGTEWKRLVFTDAIHANDALYILGKVDMKPFYINGESAKIDLNKLDAASDTTSAAPRNGKVRKIKLNDNYHKDCVFSFRLIERKSCPTDASGSGGDFLIESETKERGKEPVIAPCQGGWIKIQNGVPVLTPSDKVFEMEEAEIFNVEPTDEMPVSNVEVPTVTDVKVLAENGSVTILNAAGKKVVISNVLGQTVANTVLTSDRATIAAPQGVVVVAIEGEEAVKALVK